MAVTWQKIDESEFLKLHADGMTDPKLAKHFGVSKATVQEFRKRRDLPYNGRGKRWKRGKEIPAPTGKPVMDRASRVRILKEIKAKIERPDKREKIIERAMGWVQL